MYVDFREVAKICRDDLGLEMIGRNSLFRILRECKILQENNLPFIKYTKLDYFKVEDILIENPNQYRRVTQKTVVSKDGITFIKTVLEVQFGLI